MGQPHRLYPQNDSLGRSPCLQRSRVGAEKRSLGVAFDFYLNLAMKSSMGMAGMV